MEFGRLMAELTFEKDRNNLTDFINILLQKINYQAALMDEGTADAESRLIILQNSFQQLMNLKILILVQTDRIP